MAATMKRTMILTNQAVLTRLGREAMQPKQTQETTTSRYYDKEGNTRFRGTKKLKESQRLVYLFS